MKLLLIHKTIDKRFSKSLGNKMSEIHQLIDEASGEVSPIQFDVLDQVSIINYETK